MSVLTGLVIGGAVDIILGQHGDLLGLPQKGSPSLVKGCVITHPNDISVTSASVGVSALVLMVVLSRTRVAVFLLGDRTRGAAAAVASATSVRVEDAGKIPTGIPTPTLRISHCCPHSM